VNPRTSTVVWPVHARYVSGAVWRLSRIHAPASKSIEIEADIAKAELVQSRRDARAEVWLDKPGQVFRRHLNSRDIAVGSHAQLAEPLPANELLGGFDAPDGGDVDFRAMRNTGGEAGHGRLVPRAQTKSS
jgi:hypothetical protein